MTDPDKTNEMKDALDSLASTYKSAAILADKTLAAFPDADDKLKDLLGEVKEQNERAQRRINSIY